MYREADVPACPHCAGPLGPKDLLRACLGCGGVFVGRGLPPPPVDRSFWRRATPRHCPDCGDEMQPRTALREVFDWCPHGCGEWFDAGSLTELFPDESSIYAGLEEVQRRMGARA